MRQFKAKAKREMCVNGAYIKKVWRHFSDEILLKTCMNLDEVFLLVYEDGEWVDPKEIKKSLFDEENIVSSSTERKAAEATEVALKKNELKLFVETATVADLKARLIDSGFDKKELSDLNKPDLVEMVLSL